MSDSPATILAAWLIAGSYAGNPATSAADQLLRDMRNQQHTVRAIHERLWFRPLLEEFAGGEPVLSPEAAGDLAPSHVLIMNPNYLEEIARQCSESSLHATLVPVA